MTWEEFAARVAATTSLPKWLRDAVASFPAPGSPAPPTAGAYNGPTAADFRVMLDLVRDTRRAFPTRKEFARIGVDYPAPQPVMIGTDYGLGIVSYVTVAGAVFENVPVTEIMVPISIRRVTAFTPIPCRLETNMTPAGQGTVHTPRLLLLW